MMIMIFINETVVVRFCLFWSVITYYFSKFTIGDVWSRQFVHSNIFWFFWCQSFISRQATGPEVFLPARRCIAPSRAPWTTARSFLSATWGSMITGSKRLIVLSKRFVMIGLTRPYVRKITNDRQIMFDCDKVISHISGQLKIGSGF